MKEVLGKPVESPDPARVRELMGQIKDGIKVSTTLYMAADELGSTGLYADS